MSDEPEETKAQRKAAERLIARSWYQQGRESAANWHERQVRAFTDRADRRGAASEQLIAGDRMAAIRHLEYARLIRALPMPSNLLPLSGK